MDEVWSRRAVLPCPCSPKVDEKWGELTHAYNFIPGSLTPELAMLALLCCPIEKQGLLCQVLQMIRVKDKLFSALMTMGLAQRPSSDIYLGGEGNTLPPMAPPNIAKWGQHSHTQLWA